MGSRLISCCALLAWLALASVAAEPAAKAELPELVIGDAYEVVVKRQEKTDAIGYVLVKQTDDWLVVGTYMSQGTCECNDWYSTACDFVNMLIPSRHRIEPEHVPVLGTWLTKSGVAYQQVHLWVPRVNIKSIERVEGAIDPIFTAFPKDSPSLETKSSVYYGFGNEATSGVEAESIALDNGELSFTANGKPTKVALTDVRFIYQAILFDYAKFKAEHEKKLPAK